MASNGGPQWQSASLADILPPEFEQICSTASDIAGTAADGFEVAGDTLKTITDLLEAFNIFDWLGALADRIERFKEDVLGTGFYFLWSPDEPVKQLLDRQSAESSPFWKSLYTENAKPVDEWWDSLPSEALRASVAFRAGAPIRDTALTSDGILDSTGRAKKWAELDSGSQGTIQRFYLVEYTEVAMNDNYAKWISRVIRSFDDTGDQNRPQFGPGANVACLTLFLAAPTGAEFVALFQQLIRLFPSKGELARILAKLRRILGQNTDGYYCARAGEDRDKWEPINNVYDRWSDCLVKNKPTSQFSMCMTCPFFRYLYGIRGRSRPPDWNSDYTLRKLLPSVADAIDKGVMPLIAMLRTGQNWMIVILYLLEILTLKIRQLEDISRKLEDLLDALATIIGATGFYGLWIDTSEHADPARDATAMDTVKRCMSGAAVPPGLQYDFLIVGASLVAGGPGFSQFKTLFGGVA